MQDKGFENFFQQFNKATENLSGMVNMDVDWFKYADLLRIRDVSDVSGAFFSCFVYKAIQEKLFIHSASANYAPFKCHDEKTFNPESLFKKLKKEILKAGSDLIPLCHQYRVDKEFEDDFYLNESSDGVTAFINNNSCIILELIPTKDAKKVAYDVVTTDKDFFLKVKKIVDKYLDLSPSSKNLYVVVDSKDGPELENIGLAAKELDKDNYSEEVVKDIEYVTTQFSKDDPFGRLVILHGIPGTGKTHAIQGLIHSLNFKNVKFIFLPSDFLMGFNVAALTKLLVSESDGASLVLIIEDGDDCLVPRGSDNMSAVSKLLNLSDGFLGKMLDVRILITTNAQEYSVDSALQRPGRLSKIINVDRLNPDQAAKIVKKHTNQDHKFNEPKTLAEVFSTIHKLNGDADFKLEEKSAIGFSR